MCPQDFVQLIMGSLLTFCLAQNVYIFSQKLVINLDHLEVLIDMEQGSDLSGSLLIQSDQMCENLF